MFLLIFKILGAFSKTTTDILLIFLNIILRIYLKTGGTEFPHYLNC